MRISALIATCFIFLAGCATPILESYVGRSIQEPILDYGPPVAVIDLNDGSRAFQWAINIGGAYPVTTGSVTNIYGSGGGWATAVTTGTTMVPWSQSCLYTLITRRSGNDWIITGFRPPRWECS